MPIKPQSADSTVLQQDSSFAPLKTGFPFAENPAAETLAADPKKQFIESQIRTAVPVAQKKISDKTEAPPVKADSTLLRTRLNPEGELFRFNDILVKPKGKAGSSPPKAVVSIPSFFGDHSLRLTNPQAMAINRDTSVWVFFVLLAILTGFAWIRVFYARTIRQLFQAAVNAAVTNQMLRDENMLLQRASVLLTILFNLGLAFFLYEISITFEWSSDYIGSGFGRFLVFALIISIVYLVKYVVLRITGYILKADKAVAGYIFNIFLINNVLGIIMLPLIIGISFLPAFYARQLAIAAAGIVALAFVYRVLRGILIGLGHSEFSRFHLFLYLCALEIAPILVFVKLLK